MPTRKKAVLSCYAQEIAASKGVTSDTKPDMLAEIHVPVSVCLSDIQKQERVRGRMTYTICSHCAALKRVLYIASPGREGVMGGRTTEGAATLIYFRIPT